MNKTCRLMIIMAAIPFGLWARVTAVPEIDGSLAGSALAFAAGAMLVIRGYRRR